MHCMELLIVFIVDRNKSDIRDESKRKEVMREFRSPDVKFAIRSYIRSVSFSFFGEGKDDVEKVLEGKATWETCWVLMMHFKTEQLEERS
jgi:hypothetical protein